MGGLTRDFDFFYAFIWVVLYVNIDSNRLSVVVELFIERSLQMKFVWAHHELFADLHWRLLALLAWCVHDLPNRQPHRIPIEEIHFYWEDFPHW